MIGRQAFTLAIAIALLASGALLLTSYAMAPAEAGSGDVFLYTNATVETTHWAMVTGNTTLYPRGQVLNDSSMYLLEACPVLNVTVDVSLPRDGMVLRVAMFAVLSAERDGEVFWTEEAVMMDESIVAGRTYSGECGVNMSSTRERISEVDGEMQGAGEMRLALRLIVEVGDMGSSTTEAPMSVTGTAYWAEGDLDHRITERTTVAGSPDPSPGFPWALVIGPVLLACSLLLAYSAWPEGGLDLSERRRRRAYREWVSEGRIPGFRAEANIRVEDLGSLVDIAMDLGKRVIHDPDRGIYAVIDTRVVYYFVERT